MNHSQPGPANSRPRWYALAAISLAGLLPLVAAIALVAWQLQDHEPPPAPPVEIAANAQGVQELTLVITASGYEPARFAVKKGLPVRMTFRQLGEVFCGTTLNFPVAPDDVVTMQLLSPGDRRVLDFTPRQAGEFEFWCEHQTYRGLMVVRE